MNSATSRPVCLPPSGKRINEWLWPQTRRLNEQGVAGWWLDLDEPEASRAASAAFSPDTIILLNVLEHIRADEKALIFLREVASPGGRIVVIVPALAALYNGLDREAELRQQSHLWQAERLRLQQEIRRLRIKAAAECEMELPV